jgi:hypothetical protein
VTVWGTARVDLREPAGLWVPIAWLAAVLWPPLPITLVVWPSQLTPIGIARDWRITALIAGGVGVGLILALIDRERRREGSPRTRLGVFVRFVAYGFVFALLATVFVAVVVALLAIFGQGDVYQRLGEMKTALIVGLAALPLGLIIGISYAVWSGLAASIVAFAPAGPSIRLRRAGIEPEGMEAPAAMAAGPEPVLVGPKPETDIEAALRPDWD